jgi:hypothetical protein
MQLSFYDTINLSPVDLLAANDQAMKQDDRVLAIVKEMGKATPFEVSREYDKRYDPAPITSLRRSLTTLTKLGKLEKCEEMREERYGRNNHYWRVKI